MISVGVEFGVTLFVELVGKLRIIPSRKNEIFAPYRLALYRVEIGYDYIVYVIINIFKIQQNTHLYVCAHWEKDVELQFVLVSDGPVTLKWVFELKI